MPINEKLSSRLLVDYALSRVAEQVQDVKLATALKSCVYTVYNVYAANVWNLFKDTGSFCIAKFKKTIVEILVLKRDF